MNLNELLGWMSSTWIWSEETPKLEILEISVKFHDLIGKFFQQIQDQFFVSIYM